MVFVSGLPELNQNLLATLSKRRLLVRFEEFPFADLLMQCTHFPFLA